MYPKIKLKGYETSNYAIDNTLNEVKEYVSKSSDYTKINSEDKKYDFVMALGVVYTYTIKDSIKVLSEIERVGKGKSFITLASYTNNEDYWLFKDWTLIGSTILKKEEWKEVPQANYTGDYYFTI